MIYPVVVYGHPVLREVATNIGKDYEGLDELISDLWKTMYKADGLGLAAPQIGKSIRLFVIDADVLKDEFPELTGFKKVFINAKIEFLDTRLEFAVEGCLSVPLINEKVKRPSRIRITYQDEQFNHHDEVYDGFAARIIQHEYDHIEGKLFIDYLHPIKRYFLKNKLNKIRTGDVEVSYAIKTID